MGSVVLPYGCCFKPKDYQLLNFLCYKVTERPLPSEGFVTECDLYGDKDPSQLFQGLEDDSIYLFTKLKTKTKNSRKRVERTVGGSSNIKGTWKNQRQFKIRRLDGATGRRKIIGHKRSFIYERNKKFAAADVDGNNKRWWLKYKWLMGEYTLTDAILKHVKPQFKGYALCKIKRVELENLDDGDDEEEEEEEGEGVVELLTNINQEPHVTAVVESGRGAKRVNEELEAEELQRVKKRGKLNHQEPALIEIMNQEEPGFVVAESQRMDIQEVAGTKKNLESLLFEEEIDGNYIDTEAASSSSGLYYPGLEPKPTSCGGGMCEYPYSESVPTSSFSGFDDAAMGGEVWYATDASKARFAPPIESFFLHQGYNVSEIDNDLKMLLEEIYSTPPTGELLGYPDYDSVNLDYDLEMTMPMMLWS